MRPEDDAKANMTCHKTLAAVSTLEGIRHAPAACIGSVCSAWRWGAKQWAEPIIWYCPDREAIKEPARPAGVAADAHFVPDSGDYPARWVESIDSVKRRQAEMDAHPLGYCGAAGSWS